MNFINKMALIMAAGNMRTELSAQEFTNDDMKALTGMDTYEIIKIFEEDINHSYGYMEAIKDQHILTESQVKELRRFIDKCKAEGPMPYMDGSYTILPDLKTIVKRMTLNKRYRVKDYFK
jgi:hypothetical protein